ncbi:MAG: sodium:solute symporter [Candidatus Aminicenantales bacterium]
MTLKIVVMAVYVILIVAISIVRGRRTRTFFDYFMGGGRIGPWMTAFTYGAAYFSAVIFIGFSGKVGWSFGYSGLWIAVGNTLIGVLAVWWLLGFKVKTMAQEYGVTTMAEFFGKRYRSRFLKVFSPICIFVFFVPYSAAVFIGLSYLFRLNFNMDYWQALALMGLFTAFYLAVGGYRSMTMLDVMFGLLMLAGGTVLFISILIKSDGLPAISAELSAIDPKLVEAVGPPGLWPLFALVFLTSVAPFGMPQLIQKFYAVRDRRAIRIGMGISTLFAAVLTGVAYFAGSVTRLYLTPESAPAAFSAGKPVFDALMPELLARVVPASLLILILLLILSASMSTLAALVLISSSAVAKDLYAGLIRPQAPDRMLTLMMRVLSVFFVLISVVIAYFRPATIVSILGISWGAIGSVFLGPFVWGLLSRRTTRAAAVSAAVLALTVCLVLYVRGMPSPEAGTIGMIVSLVVPPVFSLFQKR